MIRLGGQAECSISVTQHAAELAGVIGHFPRSVIMLEGQAIEQVSGPHGDVVGYRQAAI